MFKSLSTILAESRKTASEQGDGGLSLCVRTPDGGMACSCGCLEEEPIAELSFDQEIDLYEELLEEEHGGKYVVSPQAQRTVLSADTREVSAMSKEKEFELSLKDNAHYQAALAEAKSPADKARVDTYRSNLRAIYMQSHRDEVEAQARQERQDAIRAEAEERLANQQHEAAVASEMQRLQGAAA